MGTIDSNGGKRKLVCFLSRAREEVAEVTRLLADRRVAVRHCADVPQLTDAMETSGDTILVVDTRALPPSWDIARLVDHLVETRGARPALVCVAPCGDTELRLQAVRAGAEAFFVAPVAADKLAERLLDFSGAPGSEPDRVLLVEDQAVAAVFASRVLEGAGMATRVVGNPLRVLDELEKFRPDLVLMDLHMPGANGIELTTLIRDHEELFDTPVLFLSTELDKDKQMDALRLGGDDFIAKPVRPRRLIESVRRGIRSARSARGRRGTGRGGGEVTGLSTGGAGADGLDAPRPGANAQTDEVGGAETRGAGVPSGTDSERDKRLAALLREALRAGGFQLMFQPIVALRDLPGERYEVSLRLRSNGGGYIQPVDFLPVAESRGLIPKIDRWVTHNALDELQHWRQSRRQLRFFVPQTMETVRSSDWVPWLRDQISKRDLIKQRPILQFDLRDVEANRDLAASRFPDLHRLGIKLCLNQFEDDPAAWRLIGGLGISLARLPLPATPGLDPEQLRQLVEKLHRLGISVIAARIEQPQTIASLLGCGVDFIQGNFLQLPGADLNFDFAEKALA